MGTEEVIGEVGTGGFTVGAGNTDDLELLVGETIKLAGNTGHGLAGFIDLECGNAAGHFLGELGDDGNCT